MGEVPFIVLVFAAAGVCALSVFGLRGLLDIRAALRNAELTRLDAPAHWQATRAWVAVVAGLLLLFAAAGLSSHAWLAAAAGAALGYAAAPPLLAAARRRIEREVCNDLALHLDLIALAMEAGSSLPAALAIGAERAPAGALRRAWRRVMLEIHAGAQPLEALRGLEQRLALPEFTALLGALRQAERFNIEPAQVLRERAGQAATRRFARAEHRARAAPLKLWATLMLCIAPCTLLVLAFPVARLLAAMLGR